MKRVNNLSIFLIFLIFFSILWGDTNFKQRFSINLKGNLRVIGNTILKYDGAIGNRTNDDLNLLYVDIDNNSSTFNSSSATIEKINSGIDISKAKIVWAGLYWQSYLHTWDKNDIGDKNNRFTDITTPEDIEEIIKNHKIRFTTPYGVYEIKAQEIKSYVTLNDSAFGWNAPGYHKYNYSCFADVTYLLKGKSPVGEYTVGNIPAQQGQTDKFEGMSYGGLKWFDGLGNYGAWVLVVVYDNKEALLEKTRNVTIFDGFTLISGFGHPQEVIHLYGFKTPKEAPQGVDSTISIFAAEGDKNILGDYARLINQNGAVLELPNAPGTDSYFASAIEGVDIRNPKYENNNGIDIHTTQVGTKGGNEPGRIGPNQTSAALEIGTATSGNARDAFMPSMVAFSTELYMPKLCYDYDLRIGKFLKIASNNREFNVTKWGDDPLELTIFLRSETTDFPIEHTKIRVTFDPDKLEYIPNSSKVSPNGINFYIPVPDIDNKGLVPIGRELTKEGGIIDAKESTYIKQDFKLKDIYYKGKFDIEVIGTIQYDKKAKPVPFLYSTKFPEGSPYHLPRCNTNPIYDPMWGEFNIERDDSDKYSSSNKGMRYSLYTQVAGKGFDISLVSYSKESGYTKELENNASVEIELIRADMLNNSSKNGYDATCEEPSVIGEGSLFKFKGGKGSSRVNIHIPDDFPTYPLNVALKNATFRVWYFTYTSKDDNKTRVISFNCKDKKDDKCFKEVYRRFYEKNDDAQKGYCLDDCIYSPHNGSCYRCMKKYFAKAVCARDNFAIRPESFRVMAYDNLEQNSTTKVKIFDNMDNNISYLAAGYLYRLEMIANIYNRANKPAIGYIQNFNQNYNISRLDFSGPSSCFERDSKYINLKFFNGELYTHPKPSSTITTPLNSLRVNNVGIYQYKVVDNKWTLIDQKGYKYKPYKNVEDCILNSNSVSGKKVGCLISSNYSGANSFYDPRFKVNPYSFDLSSIVALNNPNSANEEFLYFNDLNLSKLDIQNGDVMAVRTYGNIRAIGKNKLLLTNFANGCYGEDLNLSIEYKPNNNKSGSSTSTIGVVMSAVPLIEYSLYVNGIDNKVNVSKIDSNESISFEKRRFENKKGTRGIARVNLYLNYERHFNTPMNPIDFNLTSIRVWSKKLKAPANLDLNRFAQGKKELNYRRFFYYGRVVASQDYYKTQEEFQNTPILITRYCDLSIKECGDLGIDINKSATGRYNWWLSVNHKVEDYKDGKVQLESLLPDGASVTPLLKHLKRGIDKNVTVRDLKRYQRPFVVKINASHNSSKWLIFNPFKDEYPKFLYKVKFDLSGSGWSGIGETGHAVDSTDAVGTPSKRITW